MSFINKLIIAIGCATLILLLAGFGLVYWKADDYVSNQLSKYIQKSSHQKYTLAIDDLEVSWLPLRLTATGLHFSSRDSALINTKSGPILPHLTIKMLEVSNVDLATLLFEKRLLINRCEVMAPEISITSYTDSVTNIAWEEAKKEIGIKTLNIKKGIFKWQREVSSLETAFDINGTGLNLSEQGLQMDSLLMMFTKIVYHTPDSLYHLKCDSIILNHTGGNASIKTLKIEPLADKYEIGHIKGHETDWISATINDINVEGLVIDQFFKDSITIRSLHFSNMSTLIFRDKRLKFPNTPSKPMPNELMEKLKIRLTIDSLHITDSDITYQEHVAGTTRAGEISFNNLAVHGGPLSTAPGSVLFINASTHVMGRSLLNANFSIPMTLQSNQHTITGTLHNMDLTDFNPMMNYVAGVNIKSGISHSLDFNFSHDHERSNGELRFLYEDLNVQFIDNGGQQLSGGLDDAIATVIANTFVIKAANTAGENMRIGIIAFERDDRKSWFNYWWKSILSGIKSSTGIKEKS